MGKSKKEYQRLIQERQNKLNYLKAKKEFAEYEEKHGRSQLVDGYMFEYFVRKREEKG